jgi:hypothetical protein
MENPVAGFADESKLLKPHKKVGAELEEVNEKENSL